MWKREYPLNPYAKHEYNSFASSTPAVDAERVYFCRAEPARQVLFALDHSGKPVWERDLGPISSQHGGGASPIVIENLVILSSEQDGESYFLAVDARTGETRWKAPHQSK